MSRIRGTESLDEIVIGLLMVAEKLLFM